MAGVAALRVPLPGVQVTLLGNPSASLEWYLGLLIGPAILHLLIAVTAAASLGRELVDGSLGPWAVRVGFHTGGEGDGVVEWLFARQLLTDGVTGPVGEGDVRVWPSVHGPSRVMHLAMTSPSGSAWPGWPCISSGQPT